MTRSQKQCDVLVVGAGGSGIAAAVSASRCGAHTLLIEKNTLPGGAAIVGFHRYMCGLYINSIAKPSRTLNSGIIREICSHLKILEPRKSIVRIGKVYVFPFLTKNMLHVFYSLTDKKKYLRTLYNSSVVSVMVEKKLIRKLRVRNPKGSFDVIPKAIIDCSGEGAIVRLSGARYRLSPIKQRQLSGYSFKVKGLRNVDQMLAIKIPYLLRKAVISRKLPYYLKFTTFSLDDKSGGIFKLSVIPSNNKNRVGPARGDAVKLHRYLVSVLPAFKNSRIAEMSTEVLDREGLRAYGEYTLTTKDVIQGGKFPDGVVKNSWPIELWDQKKGPRYRYLSPGDYYQIPLRCLKVKSISNLYTAGRCISVSREALGSTRVMGTCISLGEQAGLAAAQYLSHNK